LNGNGKQLAGKEDLNEATLEHLDRHDQMKIKLHDHCTQSVKDMKVMVKKDSNDRNSIQGKESQ
jgi:hypothetical protein